MKLSKLTAAINNYDRASAATSYGYGNPSFMTHVYALLPHDMQMKLLKAAVEYSKEYLNASKEELTKMGVVIDDKSPTDYRIEIDEKAKIYENFNKRHLQDK